MAQVFKFGGASVKDAISVKNISLIISKSEDREIVIVISAMGKTTNNLEKYLNKSLENEKSNFELLNEIKSYHLEIADSLNILENNSLKKFIESCFINIEENFYKYFNDDYNLIYDQIIPFGELLSTRIISEYLLSINISNKWIDITKCLYTNNNYRDADIDWLKSEDRIKDSFKFSSLNNIFITQGFIASNSDNLFTTLGREGSDYTASIICTIINAQKVTIWKDVDGVLNADPKWFDNTQLLNNISYYEAVELAYYGATIIHPKTIKPLQNNNIPLFVKSFINPDNSGTLINENTSEDSTIPSFIFRINQVLITINPKDYSFIIEENLSDIFSLFAKNKVKINLMQNSALSFSVSVDYDVRKIPLLLRDLHSKFKVKYNVDLELVTIRHYNDETIERVTLGKEILLEQKTRNTAQLLVRNSF